MLCAVAFGDYVLIGDLQTVVVNVLFVNQRDIFRTSVIAPQDLHIVLLNLAGLFRNAVVGIGNALGKEPLPFAIGKAVVVQRFELCAQVGDQLRLAVNRLVLIALLCQKADKLRFERSFALIGVGANLGGLVFGDHRVFCGRGNDVEVWHGYFPFTIAIIAITIEIIEAMEANKPYRLFLSSIFSASILAILNSLELTNIKKAIMM